MLELGQQHLFSQHSPMVDDATTSRPHPASVSLRRRPARAGTAHRSYRLQPRRVGGDTASGLKQSLHDPDNGPGELIGVGATLTKLSLSRDDCSMRTLGPFVPSDEVDHEQSTGVEVEAEDAVEIKRPFDPEKIKVKTIPIVVEQLVSRIEHSEIDLSPDFQRAQIWDQERKSRLIESLLLRIPIPVFYVAADAADNWRVVDGVQRSSTIYDFVKDQYCLDRLEYLIQLNGKPHDQLPRPMQRRISETQLVINVIEQGTPEEVMFNIFRRINTGGMTLNGQEIRHALHPGPAREYLKELAESQEFLKATDCSIRTKRMSDRECVLRFLAFYIEPWENYSADDLDGFLGDAMTKINKMDSQERERIAVGFRKAMRAAFDIFGRDAFRKRYHDRHDRRVVSKALFEIWGVAFARRSCREIDTLVQNHEDVREKFARLINDDQEFETAISSSTGTPVRVKKRFGAIENLLAVLSEDEIGC